MLARNSPADAKKHAHTHTQHAGLDPHSKGWEGRNLNESRLGIYLLNQDFYHAT